ncbi:MAG: hypothetical protein Kow00121_62280 [Elainellaceae cyanobacterium]
MNRLILAGLSTLALFITALPIPALSHRAADATQPMLNKLGDRLGHAQTEPTNQPIDRLNIFYEDILTR